MLSIKPITSAASAGQYYSANDNYYLSDAETLDKSTGWYGKGAVDLNLSGQVNPELFLQLLEGRMLSGQQLGKMTQHGEVEHRPATDITLSAPKSVSILALVGGDTRLLAAHNQAVRDTLDVIERMAAEARVTVGGEIGFEKTNNLVVSLFQHTTSRELDPLLHDHCLIMNMTKRADGLWRSLSSRSQQDKTHPDRGFREIIYQNQHYFGLVYMSSLAKGTCDLGYGIDIKDRFGNFEITGLAPGYIEKCSKRRQQIKARLDEKGLTSAKAAETANLDTRRSKDAVDSQSLSDYWKADAKEQGVDLEGLIEHAKTRGEGAIKPLDGIMISGCAREAVSDALEHLSPFRTQLKHADLVRTAFVFSTGTIHHEEIEAEIATRFREKKLLGVESEYYTTADLVQQEKAFVKESLASVGVGFSLPSKASGIAANLLRCKDRLQLIDVNGLTHEKNLIESLIHTTEAQGLNAIVLHVGRLQSNRLGESLSRDNTTVWKTVKNFFKADLVQTVAGFSARYDKANPSECTKRDVVMVHDAQKLSYQDLSTLALLTARTDSKLVLLNNTRSSEGFSAGSPMKALKDAGFHATQSTTDAKKATFDVIQTAKAHHDLAATFAKLPAELRKTTCVVAVTSKDTVLLTELIRAELKAAGMLSLQSKEVTVRATHGLSDVQKRNAKFFEQGDYVTLNPFSDKQRHYRVTGKTEAGIELSDKVGRQHLLKLRKNTSFSVTKPKVIELSIGDQLVAEKNIYLGGRAGILLSGKTFSVAAIRDEGVELLSNKARLYFSNDELQDMALSHHYVRRPNQLTANAATVLVSLRGYQVNKQILGELADCSSTVRVFTPDKEHAIDLLDKEKLHWTLGDIATGLPSLVYRDSQFGHDVLQKDLDCLSTSLCEPHTQLDEASIAAVAVAYANAKLGSREAAYEHNVLLREAMVFALGKTKLPAIEEAIHHKMMSGDLIHANTFWISKDALACENSIILNNETEQNTVKPIATSARLLTLPKGLTQGQKDAITLGVTTRDRFTSVQGLAGVGKTTMMRELQVIAHEHGFSVVGLAPMHSSKDTLQEAGINAMTIARFLTHDKPYPPKTMFIVDEASMVGNQDYLALQTKVKSLGARMLLAGDMTQMQSQASGIPHELTVKTATQTIAYMEENIRQHKNPVLQQAVMHASNRELTASFATLETINPEHFIERTVKTPVSNKSVIEVNCRDDKTNTMDYGRIYRAIATDFLTRTPDHQDGTLIVAHAHEDRQAINQLIRRGLQAQGRLSLDEISTQRLSVKSFSQADLMLINRYKIGDVLLFGRDYSVAKRGEYFTVEGVDIDRSMLHCRGDAGELFSINPAAMAQKSRLSMYESKTATLAAGDKIRLCLTNEECGHTTNKKYTVESLADGNALLRNEEGSLSLHLNNKQDAHWDYAYTATAFAAQGLTSTFVLALELAKRTQATTHRSHEIDITRPRMQVTVYTENEKALVTRLSQLKGDKQSAYLLNQAMNGHTAANRFEKNEQPAGHSVMKAATHTKQINASADDLNRELTQSMEPLAHHLLGKPRTKQGDSLRFGRKGSLTISLKNGLWYNFETGEKGNALQLITAQMGFGEFKDTLAYARDFLNHHEGWVEPTQDKARQSSIDTSKNTPNKRAYAKKLVSDSLPIKGTLAERYLKEHRGLTQYEQAQLRFIPKLATWHGEKKAFVPALLSIAYDETGDVNHVQVTRLNPLTGAKDCDSKIVKQTYGMMKGYSIALNNRAHGHTTYLTEGVETGLSILEHESKANVHALLSKSNFLTVDVSKLTGHVVLCLDNDGEKTFKDLIIANAVTRLLESGKTVSIVIPNKAGHDFNDVLKEEGVKSLRTQLSHAVDATVFLTSAMKAVQSVVDDVSKRQKSYTRDSTEASIHETQWSTLNTMELSEGQRFNELTTLYEPTVEHYKKAPQPIKVPVQKELER